MAKLIINRISNQNSLFVNLDIHLDNNKVAKIADGGIVELEVGIGEHEIFVSALYGIYRSKKVNFSVEDENAEIVFESGPNILDNKNILLLICQGIIFWRSYYIKSVNIISEKKNDIQQKQSRRNSLIFNIISFILLLIPILYIIKHKLSFPVFYELIGNVIILLGIIFSFIISRIKKIKQIGSNFTFTYFIIMEILVLQNPFLFYYNLFMLVFLSIYSFFLYDLNDKNDLSFNSML